MQINYCNDCKKQSIFKMNYNQDSFYHNGVRLKECVNCGRYEGVDK